MKNDIQTTINSDNTSSDYTDIFKERYHELNKRLLCICGLGPSQPLKQRIPRTVCLLIVSLIVMAAQVRAMMGAWGRFNLFIECFTPLESNVVGILKILTSIIQAQETRAICDQMQKDWDDMRHSPQVNILKKYAEKGRHWTMFYFILIYGGLYLWVVIAFTPKVMDALAPLNYSRRRFDLFPTDFMVDPDDYFYEILISLAVSVSCQFIVTVAIDTLYMVAAQHVCGMLEILRYNLQNILQDTESIDLTFKPGIHEDKHYREIISCIKRHKVIVDTLYRKMNPRVHSSISCMLLREGTITFVEQAFPLLPRPIPGQSKCQSTLRLAPLIAFVSYVRHMRMYVKSIESACGWRLLIIMGLSMVGLSATGYLVVAAGNDGSTVDIMRFSCFGIAQVFHMFCNTLPSHWIMESSSFIPSSAYSCKWYMMSLRSRRLILFLIRASIEPCKITAGKVYVVSMENFSAVLQTSMSYLAMLNSLQ